MHQLAASFIRSFSVVYMKQILDVVSIIIIPFSIIIIISLCYEVYCNIINFSFVTLLKNFSFYILNPIGNATKWSAT